MNRHSLNYFELNPAEREPGPLALFAGAVFALFALWCATVFLFSL